MEKYILTSNYTKNFQINGVPYSYEKLKGEVVEGLVIPNYNRLRVPLNYDGININADIPFSSLKKASKTQKDKRKQYYENQSSVDGYGVDETTEQPSIFTVRNLLIGGIVVAVGYFALKSAKVIK